jgi:integrase
MTGLLHHDPDRRCKALEEWPEVDRRLWQAALVPGDLLEEGGARARYTDNTNRGIVYGYGRWLQWLDRHGQLDPTNLPGDRITPTRVRGYLADLERHNATQTLFNRLIQLSVAAWVMDPHRDWSWLNRMAGTIRARHRPARPKRPRLVATSELCDLGINLMAAAQQKSAACDRATSYRDGLMIALLAARPLRLANFVGLTLDRTLVLRGKEWWIQIPAAETKTKEPIELPWPDPLIAALETYLSCHRPALADRHGRWTRPAGQSLWLSIDGSPMTRRAIYDRITRCTLKGLGRPVHPHLFRDCAATTIAIEDPGHVRIASRLLGHRMLSTTEKHYNQARSVEAARLMQSVLLLLRRGEQPGQFASGRQGPSSRWSKFADVRYIADFLDDNVSVSVLHAGHDPRKAQPSKARQELEQAPVRCISC